MYLCMNSDSVRAMTIEFGDCTWYMHTRGSHGICHCGDNLVWRCHFETMVSRSPVNRILAALNHSQLFATPSKTNMNRLGLLDGIGFEEGSGIECNELHRTHSVLIHYKQLAINKLYYNFVETGLTIFFLRGLNSSPCTFGQAHNLLI